MTVPLYCVTVSESTFTLVAVTCAVVVTNARRVVVTTRVLKNRIHQFMPACRRERCAKVVIGDKTYEVTGGALVVIHFVDTVAVVVPVKKLCVKDEVEVPR